MLLRPSRHPFLLLFFQLILLSFGSTVYAALVRYGTPVRRNPDQEISTATTVTTVVTQTATPMGQATETCVITLTPITVNGVPDVEEVKECTFTLDSDSWGVSGGTSTGGGPEGGSSAGSTNTSSTSATTTTSSASGSTASNPAVQVNGVSSVPATPSSSAANASGSTASNPAVTVNGVSSVPVTPSPTSSSMSATSSATSPTPTPTASPSASAAADNASSSAAASSASAAAANASSQAAFTLPGKKLSVLPIGLGVFAGVSVIALIVVGLVTYERTKYRKAFRQRKLAESGQEMGYGGMV